MGFSKAFKYSRALISISQLAKCICHPARLLILVQIQDTPMRSIEIAQSHPLHPKTVAKHISILLKNELISATHSKNITYYSYNPDLIPSLLKRAILEAKDQKVALSIPPENPNIEFR